MKILQRNPMKANWAKSWDNGQRIGYIPIILICVGPFISLVPLPGFGEVAIMLMGAGVGSLLMWDALLNCFYEDYINGGN